MTDAVTPGEAPAAPMASDVAADRDGGVDGAEESAAGSAVDGDAWVPVLHTVPTRHGPARLHVWGSAGVSDVEGPAGRLVLGHGAGGGVQASDLQALASTLAAGRGDRPYGGSSGMPVQVVLVEQPWRVAGRRIAPRPAVLDEAWLDVLAQLADVLGSARRTFIGGRSAGARVCARTAELAPMPIDGVVLLAFPLQPPQRRAARDAGRPAPAPRTPELVHLAHSGVPVLVVQGDLDPFGAAEDVVAALTGDSGDDAHHWEVVAVPGADHEFQARGTQSGQNLDAVVRAVRDLMLRAGLE